MQDLALSVHLSPAPSYSQANLLTRLSDTHRVEVTCSGRPYQPIY